MGIFNSISNWNEAKRQQRIENMKDQGKCPDCVGKGFNPILYTEFAFSNLHECPGCNGSGSYSDWATTNGLE